MQVLNLSYNSLDKVIPDRLTNCSNLKELHLYHNLLKGAIPLGIGCLKNMGFLAHNDNNLIGTIPPDLGNVRMRPTSVLPCPKADIQVSECTYAKEPSK
jgi:hypothetical protein